MPEAARLLEDADTSLRAAELLLREGLYRDATSRAYYAMFHAARALLASKGVRPRTHGGLLRELGRHFVKPGILDREAAGDLGYGMQLRQRADYSDALPVTEGDARGLVGRAAIFIERAKGVLGER